MAWSVPALMKHPLKKRFALAKSFQRHKSYHNPPSPSIGGDYASRVLPDTKKTSFPMKRRGHSKAMNISAKQRPLSKDNAEGNSLGSISCV
jgi:hypothetical protein